MLARAVLIFIVAAFAPRLAAGQGAPGPAMPMGMDIQKATVGSWAEYTVQLAEMPPMKQHFALVARDAETNSVEMTSAGGMMGTNAKVVIKAVLEADPAKKERVRKIVMQIGDNEPMELPMDGGLQKDQFAPLNPKKLVGTKKVQVPAGSFTTKLYRDKAPGKKGAVTEVWVSDLAPPFGIVKLQGSVTQGPEAKYPLTMELAAQGRDAKPAITKPARPFDQSVLMGQMGRAVGSPAGAPAPKVK